MESQINAWVQWSASELKELVEDEDSCVYFEKTKRHIALQPFHLNNLNKALNEILSKSIYQYDPALKGLLLSYKNPKLLSSLGSILYDSYFIHVDIEADFYVFKPEIGCTLNGVVNKQAANHIGVLVHKAFHVSIPLNEGDKAWEGHDLYVGEDVKFIVTELDFKGKLPFIRGKLLSDYTSTNDDGNSQLKPITPKYSHTIINGGENEDTDDKTDEENLATNSSKRSKRSKRINFLTSVLNQSSESSSEEEKEVIVKPSKRKPKAPIHDVKRNETEKTSTIERKDNVASPSKSEYLNNKIENDRDLPEQKVKKKSRSRKKVKSDSEHEDEDAKFNPKNLNEIQSNVVSDEVSPAVIANSDRKPRIIHDRVLNGNERSIKIERTPMKSSKKKSIFAHDISDSDDDSDKAQKVLTQSTYSIVTEKHRENGDGKYSNGRGIANAAEVDDESEETPEIFSKKAIKSEKERKVSTGNSVDTKEHLKNNVIVTTSTPVRTNKFKEKSPKSHIAQSPINNHAKDDHSDGSTDVSSTEDERKMKKKLKKKLKKLTSVEIQETNIGHSSHSLKIEKVRAAISPQKLRKDHELGSASENESIEFKSPKKIKIRKHETNIFATVKIKHEPDASDIENASSSKVDRKHKSYTMNDTNDTNSFDEATVKSEQVNVKTEVKNKSERKRKHKEENKNIGKVKCESDTSDTDINFLPKKKIKTIFSE